MQERTLKTLADRLNYAMHEMGMSQGQLAKAANMAQPTIWRITSGNARGTTKIVEIANALGVRSEWLSNGTGPMRGDDQQPPPPMNNKKDPAIFRVDVLDLTVSAGPGIINSEFVAPWNTQLKMPVKCLMAGNRSRYASSTFEVIACLAP